jgi:hypothetical protein
MRTQHLEKRMQQRSIPEIGIYLVTVFGVQRRAGNGAISYSFDKKGWRKVEAFLGTWELKAMHQLKKLYVVQGDDGALITAAYRKA